MRVRRLVLAFPLVLGACFSYRPVTTVARPAGSRVNVLLSDAGAIRLAPRIGERVSNVEGTVLASDGDSLTLALALVRRRGEGTVGWAGERITLHRADMAV
ncbi:MAG TPA: hypothetical protein VNA89_04705, partial [Gemmatimonadaceae bacterium]|nr:hypothetical protein [Gemmatimonadaceae bacterium]